MITPIKAALQFPKHKYLSSPNAQPQTDSAHLLLDVIASNEELCFAVILAFARMFDGTAYGVPFIHKGQRTVLRAEIEQNSTLAQALSSCSFEALEQSSEIALVICDAQSRPEDCLPTLQFEIGDSSTELTLFYDASAISVLSATDFLQKISHIITALREAPETRCHALALITGSSASFFTDLRQEIITKQFERVPQTFQRISELYGDQIAVSDGSNNYTYSHLSKSVRYLASELIKAGLQSGDVVLLSGVASFGMYASMLATMTAGGVLVTLDLSLPLERQQLIQKICEPKFVISVRSNTTTDVIPGLTMEDWPSLYSLEQLPERPWLSVPLSDSAYIFFTSGSSGVPKGVLGSHLGLAHFLDWERSSFPIGPGDRVAQIVALSFDPVLRDILLPLTSGACLLVPPRELIFDARKVLRWFTNAKITLIHCVPSLMKAWLQADVEGVPFSSLRYILFAGEPLTDNLLKRFREASGAGTQIHNLYGPTETTLAKLSHWVEHVEPGVQPIGKPQPGVEVAIYRGRESLCGLWETGEIAIRTPYRSNGYFRSPALTSEVFRANNRRDDAQDLVYFTGDLGRMRSDGCIEIFGRADTQFKIRGQRIEPNEVEDCMLGLPGVKDAAVTVRVGINEEKVLFGLVVPDHPSTFADSQAFSQNARAILKTKLVDAMVPSRIIVLEALPYLPNGKLDRKSIAAFELSFGETSAVSLGDDAHIDARLRSLIRRIEGTLETKVDSLDRSFVDLGGDSLSFIRISLEIENVLGYLPSQWETKSLAELANLLSAQPEQTAKVTDSHSWWSVFTRLFSGDVNRGPGFEGYWSSLETNVLFRAIAIVLVVLDHIFESTGGLNIVSTTALFFISGHSFGRFVVPQLWSTGNARSTGKFIFAFAVPAALYQLFRAIHFKYVWLPDLFLFGTLYQSPTNPHYTYWYLDMLACNLILLTLIVLSARHWLYAKKQTLSFQFTIVVFLFGVLISLLQNETNIWNGTPGHSSVSPFLCFWIIALGWASSAIDNIQKRIVVSVIIAVIALLKITNIRGLDSVFAAVSPFFYLCTLTILWFPRVRIPRILKPVILTVATSTLMIYITNPIAMNMLIPMARVQNNWLLEACLAIGLGIVAHHLWNFGIRQLTIRFRNAKSVTDETHQAQL